MKCPLVVLAMVVCLSQVVWTVDLSCGNNGKCLDSLARRLVKSIRQNETVKVFDAFTIEPMEPVVEARSNEGLLARFFNTHAIKFDFGQYGVRVKRAARKDASVQLEVEENQVTNVKGEEGRRRNKKFMQVFLPVMLGFKAASTTIVAVAAVALLTFKAFLASKLALLVTGSMLIKKLLENFGGSTGAQHHPYLYNQYPLDFPSAGAHPGYAMGQSAYASPEGYGLTGLGSQHQELLQQPLNIDSAHDGAGQYSQAIANIHNPNVTSKFSQPVAGKRWDGMKKKSMYYDNSRPSSEANSGFQEYDPYEKYH